MKKVLIASLLVLIASSDFVRASDASELELTPTMLQEMLVASDSHFKIKPQDRRSKDAIPIPSAIAFDNNGCFAGFFSAAELQKLSFKCIPKTGHLALTAIDSATAKMANSKLVVLELIPGFAIGRCAKCATMSQDLHNVLKSKGVEATVVRSTIGIR